jgi:hypothetical protein
MGAEAYGSVTVAHSANAIIEPAATAADYDEANEHVNATEDIHGSDGALVDIAGDQTITGEKTFEDAILEAPASTDGTFANPTLTSPNVGATEWTDANHAHAGASSGGQVAHSALTGLTTGDPHTQYQKESEKDVAGGYAGLDGDGVVTGVFLPDPVLELGDADSGLTTQSLTNASPGPKTLGTINLDADTGRYLVFATCRGFSTNGSVTRVAFFCDLVTGTALGGLDNIAHSHEDVTEHSGVTLVTLVDTDGAAVQLRFRAQNVGGAGNADTSTEGSIKAVKVAF